MPSINHSKDLNSYRHAGNALHSKSEVTARTASALPINCAPADPLTGEMQRGLLLLVDHLEDPRVRC